MNKVVFNVFLVTFLFCVLEAQAQDFSLPKNPEAGKCYERCFNYDKPFEWKEVDCNTEIANREKTKTKEELLKIEKEKIKLIKYQEKLVSLGYDVNISGIADNKTIVAHHKYLKKRKKQERKMKRKNRN